MKEEKEYFVHEDSWRVSDEGRERIFCARVVIC